MLAHIRSNGIRIPIRDKTDDFTMIHLKMRIADFTMRDVWRVSVTGLTGREVKINGKI